MMYGANYHDKWAVPMTFGAYTHDEWAETGKMPKKLAKLKFWRNGLFDGRMDFLFRDYLLKFLNTCSGILKIP